MLTEKAIQEFKKMWIETHKGESFTDEQIEATAYKVFRAIELLYEED